MRRNPLEPLGRILAAPFHWFARMLKRFYEMLLARPVAYQRTSRLLAAGIGATIGLFVGATIVGNIVLFQSLKLIDTLRTVAALGTFGFVGKEEWPPEQAALFTILLTLLGAVWGFGMLKMKPGLLRAVVSFIASTALFVSLVMLFRWWFGYKPWDLGAIVMLAGMPSAFGFIWGMGGWQKENLTIEAAHEARLHPVSREPNLGGFDGVKFNYRLLNFIGTRIWPVIRPLMVPLLVILAGVLLVVVLIMFVGTLGPKKVQVSNTNAEATTIAGYVEGFELFGQPVSKFVFFLAGAISTLGSVGLLALIITLIVNALSNGVKKARQAPKEPVEVGAQKHGLGALFSRALLFGRRLARFFTDWIADILGMQVDTPSKG